MTLRAALADAARQFEKAGVGAPRLTAEVLLAHTLGRDRSYLIAHDQDPCPSSFAALVHQRLEGVPTQYLTGRQEFYGRDFAVTPGVLIPRPETEHVVERALELAPGASAIADIGCGSGIIGITLALELRRPTLLTDLSPAALTLARRNAERLHAACDFLEADLLTACRPHSLDLIVSNPPYIPLGDRPTLATEVRDHEPSLALFGGESGNDVYARLLADAPRVLRPGGWLVLELGWQSAAAVTALAQEHFTQIEVGQDLAGHDRVFSARLK
jgi:release factor glutamine methyltransferase